jgi:hypothetical protein
VATSKKWYDSAKFKKLKERWYKKLSDAGFEDVEYDENHLREYDSSITRRYDVHQIGPKAEYYRLAGQFFYDHKFDTARDKSIWDLHSQGLSVTAIAHKLKHKGYKAVTKTPVHVTVQKLAKEMLKKYGSDDSN